MVLSTVPPPSVARVPTPLMGALENARERSSKKSSLFLLFSFLFFLFFYEVIIILAKTFHSRLRANNLGE